MFVFRLCILITQPISNVTVDPYEAVFSLDVADVFFLFPSSHRPSIYITDQVIKVQNQNQNINNIPVSSMPR